MKKQQEVKIIGLSINQSIGILNAVNIIFDQESKLMPVMGEVGSGKSTLKTALQLGTVGSNTLKDKSLYGNIDEEVQLLDGDHNIFIGCKSTEKGDLDYVLYIKDAEGKIIKDPIIDGVKATPATYLKSLQTALTWRIDEVTSENPTVQKKILLEIYKRELAGLGVVYDKAHPDYVNSILGKIEAAESGRSEKEYLRKQIGGFKKHLKEDGYDTDKPETLPSRVDVSELEKRKNKLEHDIENIADTLVREKEQALGELQNKAAAVTVKLSEQNNKIQAKNDKNKLDFEKRKGQYDENNGLLKQILDNLATLEERELIKPDEVTSLRMRLSTVVDIKAFNEEFTPLPLIPFEGDKCTAQSWHEDGVVLDLITELSDLRNKYVEVDEKEINSDTGEKENELTAVREELSNASGINKACDRVDAFRSWQIANEEVLELKTEYAGLLKSIDTGVEGLMIYVDEETEKLDVYMKYNGQYDPGYFSNPDKEFRKLSSYSGTQKPLICLLLQNYLLSKKHKAMRYLWIDNVPIDKKTRGLLERMGKELNLTIFVNITGDFSKESLQNGEILVEGGEVFFK